MAVADFAHLLKAAIGLDAASIGVSAIERAVLERASACGVAGPDAYWQRVCASPVELQQLIEAVVVPETWFFRDHKAFSTLARLARDRSWATRGGVRRILSVPCSTGEEPYSIAMTLLDAGVPAGRFCIDAVDVSAHAIGVARRAVYRRNSFRGRQLAFQPRYFAATAAGHLLADSVRHLVQFRQGNLLAPDAAAEPARYDVIFCRNLLIYFDRPTQERAVRTLHRLLAADGVVIVAPSETSVLLNCGFDALEPPDACAFRTAAAASPQAPAVIASPRAFAAGPPSPASRVARTAVRPVMPAPTRPPATGAAAAPDLSLREAAELANRGHFDDAIAYCERHLARSGPSAEVFHLMGLVRDASGDPAEATRCYRRALYLNPNHIEVLLHLTLLLEKAGNTAEAQVLRKRAQRLQQHSGPNDAPVLR